MRNITVSTTTMPSGAIEIVSKYAPLDLQISGYFYSDRQVLETWAGGDDGKWSSTDERCITPQQALESVVLSMIIAIAMMNAKK